MLPTEEKNTTNNGFTLVELLIVIAIISILAAIVFVSLNPLARFQDARNTRRWTDVNTVLSSLKLYQVDNNGSYPASVTALTSDLFYQIGTSGTGCNDTCANPTVTLQGACADLTTLATSGYLPAVPIDPNSTGADATETRYYISKATNGIVTIGSCSEENGTASTPSAISVAR